MYKQRSKKTHIIVYNTLWNTRKEIISPFTL